MGFKKGKEKNGSFSSFQGLCVHVHRRTVEAVNYCDRESEKEVIYVKDMMEGGLVR